MSTVTHARPRRGTRRGTPRSTGTPASTGPPRGRIVSGTLALVFLAEFCALTSFYLMLSVTPMYAAAAGAGSAGAGLVTGVLLLGTVAAELAAPILVRRFGYRALLAAGALLLGAPALALLPGGPLPVIVPVSIVRGFGFGLSTVMAGALTAMLVPARAARRRARPFRDRGHRAGNRGAAGRCLARWPPRHGGGRRPDGRDRPDPARRGPVAARPDRPEGGGAERRRAAGRACWPACAGAGQLRPFLIFAASTVAAGVVVSFLPLATGVSGNLAAAGLLAQALTATIGRWWAGRQGDRSGHARLLVPALVIASLGMIAMIWLASPAAVIAGMCLFGAGFGICQNATFVTDDRPDAAIRAGTASALWNLAYDAGYGAGPAIFGLLVSHTGYPAAFALTAVLMLVALPAARRERSAA